MKQHHEKTSFNTEPFTDNYSAGSFSEPKYLTMAKQVINTGTTANDRTGDPLRTAFEKAKANFDELYAEIHFKGKYVSLVALQTAHATAEDGDYAIVDAGEGINAQEYIWDEDDGWILEVSSASITTALGYTPASATDLTAETAARIAADLLKVDKINSAVVLTDAATMDLTATKHTLASSSATRTFTISYTGDDITVEVTLSATSSTYTFPATSLCVSEGTASGNNTLALSGVSGDKYIIAIKKIGSAYYVVSKNFGQ